MNIGILGAAGRMGQMLLRELLSNNHAPAILSAATDHNQSWALGKDAGEITGIGPSGILLTPDKEAAFNASDLLIDFTTPDATTEHAALAVQHRKALVVGTTGLQAEHEAALLTAAKTVPVLYAANMSLGVNLLSALVEQVAARLDNDFDIEIYDAHHRHKIDAPSGTALLLGHAAARGRGVKLDDAIVPARHGQIGARPEGAIGMSVFRGGDVIGDHTVTFAGTGERLDLSHKATDRAIFARGAIRAALWLKSQPAGLYSIKDMLNL